MTTGQLHINKRPRRRRRACGNSTFKSECRRFERHTASWEIKYRHRQYARSCRQVYDGKLGIDSGVHSLVSAVRVFAPKEVDEGTKGYATEPNIAASTLLRPW